jgi:GrpB-like predicted nucleotidyltransferase (UPF0157 family)
MDVLLSKHIHIHTNNTFEKHYSLKENIHVYTNSGQYDQFFELFKFYLRKTPEYI